MGTYAGDDEFGGGTGELRNVIVATGVSATLQAFEESEEEWVPVPDGAYTGPTVGTFYCTPGITYRFGSVTAGKFVTMSGSSGRAGG